jgi:hypothetical protein
MFKSPKQMPNVTGKKIRNKHYYNGFQCYPLSHLCYIVYNVLLFTLHESGTSPGTVYMYFITPHLKMAQVPVQVLYTCTLLHLI